MAEPQPRMLSLRAKRMYAQETINLALAYPYLAPILDEYVFTPYWHADLKAQIVIFSTSLIHLGLRKLYPDAIAHAIFLALKYDFALGLEDDQLIEIETLDDCVANVLLLEYAKRNARKKVIKAVTARANELEQADPREKDRHWLLIYQVWSEKDLKGNGQGFLAELKGMGFQFFSRPQLPQETAVGDMEGGVAPAEIAANPIKAKDEA